MKRNNISRNVFRYEMFFTIREIIRKAVRG